jgi:hypothetical protein
MSASTKEQIVAAASKAFRRKEVQIAEGVTISVREMSRDEREYLDRLLFLTGPDGKVVETDGQAAFREGVHFREEWLAATLEPAFTVQELLGNEWPASVKAMLFREAQAVNGLTIEAAVKNS